MPAIFESVLTELSALAYNSQARGDCDKILGVLDINEGDTVADIGTGGGYYACLFARKVGLKGKVFAVDINRALLSRLERAAERRGITNIVVILGDQSGCSLPAASCDLVFLRNVFHHLTNPDIYFKSIRGVLKAGGRLAVIDYCPRKRRVFGYIGHATREEEIIRVMSAAGFEHVISYDFLDRQSFNIFKVNS